jgi:hypothetical protein
MVTTADIADSDDDDDEDDDDDGPWRPPEVSVTRKVTTGAGSRRIPNASCSHDGGMGGGGRRQTMEGSRKNWGNIFSLPCLADQSPFSTFNGKWSQFREKEDTGPPSFSQQQINLNHNFARRPWRTKQRRGTSSSTSQT